jgi:hypothetical protein
MVSTALPSSERYIFMIDTQTYGCETWSLTMKEERTPRVMDNRVLRRILWPRRDEVTGQWRKLHNEEQNDLYCAPNIFRVIKWRRMGLARHVARMEER